MISIEQIKRQLIGKWKYDDGRLIEFAADGQFKLTPRDPSNEGIQGKFIFSNRDDNSITFSTPLLEPLCIFESISDKEFTYFDVSQDGTKKRISLTKI